MAIIILIIIAYLLSLLFFLLPLLHKIAHSTWLSFDPLSPQRNASLQIISPKQASAVDVPGCAEHRAYIDTCEKRLV